MSLNIGIFDNSLKCIASNFKLIVAMSTWVNEHLIQVNTNVEKVYPMIFKEDFELIDYLKTKLESKERQKPDMQRLFATEQHMLSYVRTLIHLKQQESFDEL